MKTKYNSKYLSLALTSVLLIPVVNSYAAQTALVSVDTDELQGVLPSVTPSVNASGRLVAFASESPLVPEDTNGVSDIYVRDRQTGETRLVSFDTTGAAAGNGGSFSPVISANGVFVAFASDASNLVANDSNNNKTDVFVRNIEKGITSLVSIGLGGAGADGESLNPAISADGRRVAFDSQATNLVLPDLNKQRDVFVRDRGTGTTTLVSVSTSGDQGNERSFAPSLSANGLIVAFSSKASNFVIPDNNGNLSDIFVHNLVSGNTVLASVDSSEVQGIKASHSPSLSANGNLVAFSSQSPLIVPGDTDNRFDIFVRNLAAGTTGIVSVDTDENQVILPSTRPSISADGLFVAFESRAPKLVGNDTNGNRDIFIRNRVAGTTKRISVDSAGGEANDDSFFPSLSADGRIVAFQSNASNLDLADGNGSVSDVFTHDRLLNTSKNANLLLEVIAKPSPSVTKGTDAHYEFKITNKGPADANNVTLIDVLSRVNMKLSTLTPSNNGKCRKAQVSVCRFGLLKKNEFATLTADIRANQLPNLVQRLSVSASPVDNLPGNNNRVVITPVVNP